MLKKLIITNSRLLSQKNSYFLTQKTKFIDYKIGPAENLFINIRDLTCLDDDYVLMKVKAVGINRAQVLHRTGKYPITSEQEKYIGLEAAGEIINPRTQEKIMNAMALLPGGGYAEFVKVRKSHIMQIPQNLSFIESASIPQAWITAYQILNLAQLTKNQSVVIYAGASGVGTAAIQIAKNILNISPFCVVSNEKKAEICKRYGAEGAVLYKENEKWSDDLLSLHNNKNFDAILDCVCSSNIDHTIKLLGVDGRWILYGTLSGIKKEVNFGKMLGKRIKLISTTLKTRSNSYKDDLIRSFEEKVLPGFQDNKLKPIIHKVLKCNWRDASAFIEAHKIMESNENVGKIIIEYD